MTHYVMLVLFIISFILAILHTLNAAYYRMRGWDVWEETAYALVALFVSVGVFMLFVVTR